MEEKDDLNRDIENAEGQTTGSNKFVFIIFGVLLLATILYGFAESVDFNLPAGELDFTLSDLDNQPYDLSQLKGKVVLLDFWATWCKPCRYTIPDLIALKEKYRDRNFEIVGVSVDRGGLELVQNFVKEYGINYPIAMTTPELEKAYGGITAYPTLFIIKPNGKIEQKIVGAQPGYVIERILDKLW